MNSGVMPTTPTLRWGPTSERFVQPADVPITLRRESALADLRHMATDVLEPALSVRDAWLRISSSQRSDGTAAVALSGRIDASGIHQLAAHLTGLLNAGTRYLVVDLSRIDLVDEHILGLMRRVEARMHVLGREFELIGLAPPVLYAMDDASLIQVFALYRGVLDDPRPQAVSWTTLRCPQGLDQVAEPGTAGRHRAIIDTGMRRPVTSRAAGDMTRTRT
jgi:anti-anti-sigma regulatory factor